MNGGSLPIETFLNIFSYLDAITCIRNKSVCQAWKKNASQNCGYLHMKCSRPIPYDYETLEAELTLEAQESCDGRIDTMCSSKHHGTNDDTEGSVSSNHHSSPLQRTKGHLPNPNVLAGEPSKLLTFCTRSRKQQRRVGDDSADGNMIDSSSCQIHCRKMDVLPISPSSLAVAIRFERIMENDKKQYLQLSQITSLDLQSIRLKHQHHPTNLTCNFATTDFGPATTNPLPSKSILLGKKSVQVLDLSSMCQLKRLSVRSCSNLTTLRLPPCLERLDASACMNLKKISFYAGTKPTLDPKISSDRGKKAHKLPSAVCHLKIMNLNGCRSLTSMKYFEDFIENVTELDMTSVSKMSKTVIAQGLKRAVRMTNISLRYIATDELVFALSAAAASNDINDQVTTNRLRLVDISFSSDVTDASVEILVNEAMNLERCNLRGNRRISGWCYNQVPIYLSRRQNKSDKKMKNFSAKDDDKIERKRRKGDNIFFFTA